MDDGLSWHDRYGLFCENLFVYIFVLLSFIWSDGDLLVHKFMTYLAFLSNNCGYFVAKD